MKIKITRKEAAQMYNVRCAGYCDLQDLFRGVEPVAYTSGVYGWDFDVYSFSGLTICTGYRGMPGTRAEGIRAYNDKARATLSDYGRPIGDRMADVATLRAKFIRLNGGEA